MVDMLLRIILCIVLFQLKFFLGKAQTGKDTILIICSVRSCEYNIYEINKTLFSFPEYGQKLGIRPKYLITGKQYFKRRLPYWLSVNLCHENKLPKGAIVKYYQKLPAIDTFLYKGIELRYPLEVDSKLLDSNTISNNENQPIIINGFQFVKKCAKYPYKHFEITTL